MSMKRTALALCALLAVGATTAAPGFANTPMRGYAQIGVPAASTAPVPLATPVVRSTGRDAITLDRNRVGAQVGDSLLRLAPTTNNGRFSQFENYQGSISATTTVDGDNYGTIVTNQNGNILGLIGNNGVVDASALQGVDTTGK